MSTREAGPKASADSSPDLAETQVIPVVPLQERGEECLHLAYEVVGKSRLPGGDWLEQCKCSDCGHRWSQPFLGPDGPEPEDEEPQQGPPPVAYGGGRIVTYQTKHGQYELILDELAMVSVQSGMLVVQHPQADVTAIVGVRPWLREVEPDAADSEG